MSVEFLKRFDVFPKTVDDAKEQSASGGGVSIFVLFCMVILFISETTMYMETATKHELEVDVSRGGMLLINFDLTFFSLPCSLISLDAMDVSGEHELDVVHDVYKRKVGRDGVAYGQVVSQKIRRQQGKDAIEQIKGELGEGCNIYGTLNAQKVAGNFHFSLHAQDFAVLTQVFPDRRMVNTSHVINHLSFGRDYPGLKHPLDGEVKILDQGTGTFEYYIKIVPTVYNDLKGKTINTNQYSVTDHFRKSLDGFPSVYFIYDISPIMVKAKQQRTAFTHYFTQLCAIIGGMYVVVGQLHRVSSQAYTHFITTEGGRRRGSFRRASVGVFEGAIAGGSKPGESRRV